MTASTASLLSGSDLQRALDFLRAQRIEAPSLEQFARSAISVTAICAPARAAS
jgi:hypothetical protein